MRVYYQIIMISKERDYGFRPSIDIRKGLRKFAEWYKDYYIDRNN